MRKKCFFYFEAFPKNITVKHYDKKSQHSVDLVASVCALTFERGQAAGASK